MRYYLQAIIGERGGLKRNAPKDARVVVLSETLALLPFNASFIDSRNIEMLAMTDAGHSELPLNICEVCESLSRNAKVAYVEAQYFGGQGGQASVKCIDMSAQRVVLSSHSTQLHSRWLPEEMYGLLLGMRLEQREGLSSLEACENCK